MDDILEQPTAVVPENDGDAQSSGDEDEVVGDWTKLQAAIKVGIDRPIIPKRGEKEFEPEGGPSTSKDSGTNLQSHALERSRNAMYSAIKAERGISNKTISYGLWFPATSHTEVTLSRGTMFSNVGYSNARPIEGFTEREGKTPGKRTELLPEEALYMMERGSLYCWRIDNTDTRTKEIIRATSLGEINLEDVHGAPMSLQQGFAEMISGNGELTAERYQVYAYLKRLGYNVIRANKPPGVTSYPLAAEPLASQTVSRTSLWNGVAQRIRRIFTWIADHISFRHIQWSCAIGLRTSTWYHKVTPSEAYRNLRIIPGGHKSPLQIKRTSTSNPYVPFYHVFKPSTPFKKSAPPPPDFYLAIVDARSTPLPSLLEMSDLFEVLPVVPIPPPRKRKTTTLPSRPNASEPSSIKPPLETTLTTAGVSPKNLLSWLRSCWPSTNVQSQGRVPNAGPNPFVALKAGNKNFVVAAVDCGAISFIRFSEGCFEDWPMV